MLSRLFVLLVCLGGFRSALAVDWVRAGVSTNQTVWGIRKGLLWAVAPAGFRSGEPRGLVRLGYPVLPDGGYDLINFIAVEPVVHGRRGFSELERSELDGVPGKRIWAEEPGDATATKLVPGTLRKSSVGSEDLAVPLRIEKFDNGAHVRLVLRQRDDRPGELALSVFQESDSAALDYCILTATMGNMARTRLVWLKNRRVSSLVLYRDYKQTGFAPHQEYPLSDLPRTADGGVLVPMSNDEDDPASVFPFPNSELWHYAGAKVTQYWAKPPGAFREDLRLAVNARFTYWRSARPVPGGVAFENFELRERFYEGQTFVFGITRSTPEALGVSR